MLKPTDSPPPSLQPRLEASMTPGPPPVTTAQPASPNLRPTMRASSYGLLPSATRAEPKSATAGRSIRSTFSSPARNSAAIFATDCSMGEVPSSRIFLSSVIEALQAVLWRIRRVHPEGQRGRRAEVERVRREREAPTAAETQVSRGAPDRATVEDAERDHVDQVQEEAGVGKRVQQPGIVRLRKGETDRRRRAAENGACDRDANRLPGVAARVLHVGAEEGDEHRQLRTEPFALRLDVVPELVDEDQQHEPDCELPAEDQRIRSDGDEDARELHEHEPELRRRDHERDHRADQLADAAGPIRAARVDRLVVTLLVEAHDPLPIHSAPSE